jgi:hypothetical protein
MQAGNEAWIQDSLARLEQLESQRQQLAASGRGDLLAELDEEIASLYEALESAADDGSGQAANTPQWSAPPQAPFVPQPVAFAPQPAPFTPQPAPFAAQPAPFAPQPVAFAPQPAAFAPIAAPQPTIDYGSSSMDVSDAGGSKAPIIVAAIVAVLAIGGAGAWFMSRGPAEEPKPTAPVGEAKVIQSGEIPPDTQDPNVAKGGDADRTPAQIIKERAQEQDRRPRPSSGSNSGPSRPREPDKPTRGPIKGAASDDPLAGVR